MGVRQRTTDPSATAATRHAGAAAARALSSLGVEQALAVHSRLEMQPSKHRKERDKQAAAVDAPGSEVGFLVAVRACNGV